MKWGEGFWRTLVWIHFVGACVLCRCCCGEIFGHDKEVLLEVKRLVAADPEGVLASWDVGSRLDHCSWYGVVCDSKSRVTGIKLVGGGGGSDGYDGGSCASMFPFRGFGIWRRCSDRGGKLVGKLSSKVAELDQLRELSLPFNRFSGEIPAEIWGLEELEVLDLEGNLFTGKIPVEFSGLRKLRVLNLRFNGISGNVPRVSNLRLSRVLDLAGNKLDGTVPEFVDSYANGCEYLEHLDLSGNALNGAIPRTLGKCRRLRNVMLFSNDFTGDIPKEIGQLRYLENLDVSRNNLSGLIPKELGNCASLSVLVLSNSFDPLLRWRSARGQANLSCYADESNHFQGSIPSGVATLWGLEMIWAPRARLEGNLPNNWGRSLKVLNLAENKFDGDITGIFTGCSNLYHLNLSSNKLVGQLEDKLRVPCMPVFDISRNLLSGDLPHFQSSQCASGVHPRKTHINLYMMSFARRASHETHSHILGVEVTVIHNFSGNNFTGPIPPLPILGEEFRKHASYAFLAARNSLSGSFPSDMAASSNDLNGLVVDISNNRISGELPSDVGTSYSSLKVLDASINLITGVIPQTIGDLGALVLLDLSGNMLHGAIPSTLGRLHSLEVLKLSSNSFSGSIPESLGNLCKLTTLHLDGNQLSGDSPSSFACMASLSLLNTSFNNVSGSVMAKDDEKQCAINYPLLSSCQKLLSRRAVLLSSDQAETDDSASSDSDSSGAAIGSSKLNSIEIASIVSASAIVSVLLALIILFIYTRKWAPDSRVQVSVPREITLFNDIGVPVTFDKIANSTANFNASNCIGNGGFGTTYRAEIAPGVIIAVKRLSVGRFHGVQQFHAEIKTLGRVRHPNLVTLVGYHASETEMFLIYNYLPGGNLAKFIQERSEKATDWKIIHKIALDIAQALAYLHDQCVPRVLHRDVKPSNVLLDNEFNAYLSDFGLSRLLGTSETHATTGVAGTFGYLAPEYAMTCRVSDKADVYSYGIVLLELLSDKKTLDPSFSAHENGFTIVSWASMLLREGRAKDVFNPRLWETGPHKKLVDTLHLAVRCTVEALSIRPTMKQVAQQLRHLQPRPESS